MKKIKVYLPSKLNTAVTSHYNENGTVIVNTILLPSFIGVLTNILCTLFQLILLQNILLYAQVHYKNYCAANDIHNAFVCMF